MPEIVENPKAAADESQTRHNTVLRVPFLALRCMLRLLTRALQFTRAASASSQAGCAHRAAQAPPAQPVDANPSALHAARLRPSLPLRQAASGRALRRAAARGPADSHCAAARAGGGGSRFSRPVAAAPAQGDENRNPNAAPIRVTRPGPTKPITRPCGT